MSSTPSLNLSRHIEHSGDALMDSSSSICRNTSCFRALRASLLSPGGLLLLKLRTEKASSDSIVKLENGESDSYHSVGASVSRFPILTTLKTPLIGNSPHDILETAVFCLAKDLEKNC